MSDTQTAPQTLPAQTATATATGTGTGTQNNAGADLLKDIQSTAQAFDKGDWLQGGLGVVKVAMDVMDVAGNPLGAIGGAGLGWVLGAISFLREPFDVLKGNSGSVSSSAQSWGSSGGGLSSAADMFRQAATDQTKNWAGTAADGYRAASTNQANGIQALATANQAVSGAMQQGGQAVAQARKSVMDLISDAVQKIIQICIEALSKSWMSFGASIAEGIAKSVQQAVQTAQKMAQTIQSLIQTLQKIVQVVQKVVQIAQQVKQLVELIGGKASGDQPQTPSTQQITSTGAMATNTNPTGGDILQAVRQAIAPGYQHTDPAMATGTSTTSTQTAATNAAYRTQDLATGTSTTSAQQATTNSPVGAVPIANGGGVQTTAPAASNPVAPVTPPPAQAGSAVTNGPVSQNGWPVNPHRGMRTIPGTNSQVNVVDGPGGDVLMHVLGQVNSRVENVDMNSDAGEHDDWGYANRNVRGSHDISNHASATAVDVNATRHVLGATNTFTPTQVNEIHNILGEVDGVVRWGGDYTGRHDEMHFEIVGTPEEVARVAERLRAAQTPQ
jgi:D-alanyl-D-alanine carboxypeptidase